MKRVHGAGSGLAWSYRGLSDHAADWSRVLSPLSGSVVGALVVLAVVLLAVVLLAVLLAAVRCNPRCPSAPIAVAAGWKLVADIEHGAANAAFLDDSISSIAAFAAACRIDVHNDADKRHGRSLNVQDAGPN